MFKRNSNNNIILTLVVFMDLLILTGAYLVSRYIMIKDLSFSSWSIKEIFTSGMLIMILFIALEKFEFSHSYRYKPLKHIIQNIFAFEIILISIFHIPVMLKIYEYKNSFILLFTVITFLSFLSERVFIKLFLTLVRKWGFDYKRFLIIGAGSVGLDFYNLLKKSDEMGVKVLGFLDDNEDLFKTENPAYTGDIKSLLLGRTDKLNTVLKNKTVDNVIVALPMDNTEKIEDIFITCENHGVKAELIPRYLKVINERPSVRNIKKFTLIGMHNVALDNLFNRFIKRLFDLLFAAVIMFILFPIFIVIMILIKSESKGPVFFRQKRTGYNQKEFSIYKFRTMKVNTEADTKQATADDPRKTNIGTFLRKTNMDEFPQLINILKGEMSVVGPRPHMLAHTEEFKKKYKKYLIRHWVKPGLTGWAQVNGWRGDSDIGMRIKYDIDYIEKWSLWLDVKITFLTIFSKKVKKHAH